MTSYYIGWDVGGWNCDKNSKSRDAIVILDYEGRQVGKPWRGNLTDIISSSNSSHDLFNSVFDLCETEVPHDSYQAVMAIDTPLGFSTEFTNLLTTQRIAENVSDHTANPYLFRTTERLLFQRGHKPLSAIKDMIGSQATKGIHTRNKFAPYVDSCGVWSDKKRLKIIEAYPASCKNSPSIMDWLDRLALGNYHQDIKDAAICSMIAYYFDKAPHQMYSPTDNIPESEGWIWTTLN